MKKNIILISYLLLKGCIFFSQNVGIGTSTPDLTAQLDVSSNSKGILIPRLTQSQRTGIASPATGLLVYQSDADSSFFCYNGISWIKQLSINSGWALTGNANTGNKFIGTTDNLPLKLRVNNQNAGTIDHIGHNLFLGYNALNTNVTGTYITALGDSAYFNNTSGYNNTAVGSSSSKANTTGHSNTAIGTNSLKNNVTGYSNVAIGIAALYSNHSSSNTVAVGDSALFANTDFFGTGVKNTGVGSKALFSNPSGSNNTATGYRSLYNNWNSFNSAFGSEALFSNVNGSANSTLGFQALYKNTDGNNNTATGYQALYNSTGSGNTATGYLSQYNTTGGANNTSMGNSSLNSNTGGSGNTAIGTQALFGNNTENNNTAVGYAAFLLNGGYSNSTAIGFQASITASNQVRIGSNSVTSIGGQVGWTVFSDLRFKKNISENVRGFDFILKLRPVTYTADMDAMTQFFKIPDSLRIKDAEKARAEMLQTGFIAQEVEKAANEIHYDFSGIDKPKNANDYYGLRYAEFVVPLVKAMQELHQQVAEQKKNNEDLKNQNQTLIKRLEILEKLVLKQ